MSLAALVRAMGDAGATPEVIALAIEAIENAQAQISTRRTADRERKARQRARERDGHVTVTVVSRDGPVTPPCPPSSPPRPPLSPTHTPGNIYSAREASFFDFWEVYPNKVGKRDAEKSYLRALSRIGGPDPPGIILAGVERAKAGRRWQDGFIPNPATWLNQDRWMDQESEIIPRKAKPDGQSTGQDARQRARHENYRNALAGFEDAVAARRE